MSLYNNTLWLLFTLLLFSTYCTANTSALLNCTCGRPHSSSSRIVNGVETSKHEFPWIVAIRRKVHALSEIPYVPFCAGSLISDRFVITAAHCLAKLKNPGDWGLVELVFGLHWVRRSPPEVEVRDIKRAVMKVQYVDEIKDHDVALIEMDTPIKVSDDLYPICLPYGIEFPTENPWVIAAGWGKTSYQGKQSEKLLKSKWMELVPFDTCKKRTKFKDRDYPLSNRMVCGVSDLTDACIGDSGGPLMYYSSKYYRWFLVGLTSFGYNCNLPNDPGVYTNLFHRGILEWVTCGNRGQMCKA